MSDGRKRLRESLAKLQTKRGELRAGRTAESIAREAYRSSRIEGCRVDYAPLVESARSLKADVRRP